MKQLITILLIIASSSCFAQTGFRIASDLRNRSGVTSIHLIIDGANRIGDDSSGYYVYVDTLSLPDDGYWVLRSTGKALGGWQKLKMDMSSVKNLIDSLTSKVNVSSLVASLTAALGSAPLKAVDTVYIHNLAVSKGNGTVTSIGLTSSDITIGGASPITGSGTYTLTLPTSGVTAGTYEYITVNAKGIVTGGYNSVTSILSTRTFGTAYQASNTSRTFEVDGTVKVNVGTALISASDGQITLDISPNGSTGWVEYSRTQNNNGAILSATNGATGYVEAKNIPAGYYYRFNSTQTTGTAVFTWVVGHETLRR